LKLPKAWWWRFIRFGYRVGWHICETIFIERLTIRSYDFRKPMVVPWAIGISTSKLPMLLGLIRARQIEVPISIIQQADQVGALIYGLLRADLRVDVG
jgi:hypothetical protein